MKILIYLLCIILLISGCNTSNSRRVIIVLLDIIPFCDKIHFSMNISKGMDISQITELYGEPKCIFFKNTDGHIMCRDNLSGELNDMTISSEKNNLKIQIKGYTPAPFQITNKVYVYLGGFDAIAYIFINSKNKIENVYIGGS